MIPSRSRWVRLIFAILIVLCPAAAFAAVPVVKTVPWVATNPLIPHDTYAGKAITLKGTSDLAGATIQYSWDFGDGTAVQTGTVIATGTPTGTQRRNTSIDAVHTYSGAAGTVFTARLTVTNTATAETANK